MIFRLTVPNWELPSPYYGSHIIMSISGVHLWHIFTYINPHIISFTCPILISGARDNIFPSHITSLQYTSAAFSRFHQLPDSRRTLSIYSMSFYHRRYAGGQLSVASLPTGIGIVISWALVGGQAAPSVFELGHCRRALHLPPAAQSLSAQVQQPSLLNIDLHSTIREQQVQTSNIISTDKYNPVRVKHQYM